MTGRLSRAAVVVALAFAGSASIPARAGATPSSAPATPIHHLVVMTQDQHSFDNYFGTRSGVDGLPSAACVPKQRGSSTPCVKPFP
ncbi:MAG: phospholipase, partial [Mycobacterium sp.]|nr:phospholipase [Mycobacterium sp.]